MFRRRNRPAAVWATFDQIDSNGIVWGVSPDRVRVGDGAVVVPTGNEIPEDRLIEHAYWGMVLEESRQGSSRWYRVQLVRRYLERSASEELAEAFVSEVQSSPQEENAMSLEHPEAWAAGARNAQSFCADKEISKLAPHQLRYMADMQLPYEPGTGEASAFIAAFVRKAQAMLRSGEAK